MENNRVSTLKSDSILLVTAAIWGFAFAFQRLGMDHIGPFLYNGIRFALGSLVLFPFTRFNKYRSTFSWWFVIGAMLAGTALFIASSLQQIGLVYTTAGKAGFITGLYVILVPFLGLLLHHTIGRHNWIGAVCAVIGLYLLSIHGHLSLQRGDIYVFFSAFFYAIHVHLIGHMAGRIRSGQLAFIQYATCSIFSLIVAIATEPIQAHAISLAAIPILYGGLFSVGIAYSLQIIGQKYAPPSHAVIFLSMESAFAVVGGWLILGEHMPLRGLIGCGFMLSGMLISQLGQQRRYRRRAAKRSEHSESSQKQTGNFPEP